MPPRVSTVSPWYAIDDLPGYGQPLVRLRAAGCGWEGGFTLLLCQDDKDLLSVWLTVLSYCSAQEQKEVQALGGLGLCS